MLVLILGFLAAAICGLDVVVAVDSFRQGRFYQASAAAACAGGLAFLAIHDALTVSS